jgi:hypothetical protein
MSQDDNEKQIALNPMEAPIMTRISAMRISLCAFMSGAFIFFGASIGQAQTLGGNSAATINITNVQLPGIIDVKAAPYNAQCDGSTDDTAAITAAVTAAGMVGANTTGGMSELFIPNGRCVISSTITLRNAWAGETGPLAVMRCSNSGFIWKGIDNTGPMFVLGDITNTNLDPGFKVENCYFSGASGPNTRPTTALLLANNSNSVISHNTFYYMYNGITCQNQCLLTTISDNFFNQAFASSFGNCVTMSIDNGSYVKGNNFYWCGKYDYYGAADASTLLQDNYFESNVAGQLGSVYLKGDGDTLASNTFEDGGTAAGTGFLSIDCEQCFYVSFHDNYFVGGSGASGPNYFYKIALASGPVSWVNEKFGGTPGTYVVDYITSTPSTWFGGLGGCTASNLVSGAGAAYFNSVSACGAFAGPFYQSATSTGNDFGVSVAGELTSNNFVSQGSAHPTYSGTCGATYNSGGISAGTFEIIGSSCSGQTVTINFPSANAAPSGWSCSANNRTTPADAVTQTGDSPTTATFKITAAVNDIVSFQCTGY